MAQNTWAVSIMRYGARIYTWNKNELQEMDRKTRKSMKINNSSQEVMLHGCIFLGKMANQELLDVKTVWRVKKMT